MGKRKGEKNLIKSEQWEKKNDIKYIYKPTEPSFTINSFKK